MKRTKKSYLSSFMAMILFASTMTISSVPTVTALAATDTNGHWAESTINKWTASGHISGYPDGTFRPNNAISRAEFVTLANKAFSYNVPTSISFKDLDTSHWAYSEIQKGVSAGYIKGDAAGTFRPGAAVTRQEAAVMMAQIKKLQQNANSALSYTDYNSIANWAKPYVGAVSNVKIMQGFPNGAFRPQTSMTRAEAVTALENAIFAPTQSSNGSSSSTKPDYNTNTNTNINSGSSNSNSNSSSSSSSASDYTLEDSSLRNRTIDGNLIISSSLGSKDVTLNGVTVKGTVKIQGGSTIKAQSCDFNKVEMDKSGVTLNADSKTKIRNLEYLQRGKIEGSGYENVYVQDSSLSEATVDATVKYLELDTDANLKLYKNADVATLEVTSNAKDGEVTFTSGAEVDDMTIRGRIRIYGKGDINDMTTYVSGIRSSVKPDRVTTRGDGEKPSYTSGESGSSSSNNGSDYDDLTLDREDRKYDADGERYHNVSIEADGVTLRDAIVYNRLTITRDVEDGEVILDDVRVRGDVYIYGGGENSVIFRNCDIQGDIISYKDTDDSRYGDEPVALEFEDGTDVDGDIKVRGDTIIRAESDIKLDNIIVDRKLSEDLIIDAKVNTLKLVGDCDVRITGRSKIDKVDINSNRDITLRMESGSYINLIDSNSDLTIRGNGTVKTIRTSKTVTTDSGIVNDDQTSTFVAVTDILGIPSIQSSYSLTLSPSVQPTNASYQTVKWSIDSGLNTAGASISDDRVLTATKDGQVRLLATIDNGKAIGTAYTKSFTVTFSYGSGTVTPPEPSTPATVKEIRISPDRESYTKGDKITLIADIEGTLAKDDEVTWTSSDPETVKVEKKSTDGRDATATILKYGEKEVTITAKVGTETGKTKTIKVSAAPLPHITGIEVSGKNNASAASAKVNDEFTIKANITNFDAASVQWRVIEDGGTETSNLVELAESETTTESTTLKIKSQKTNNTTLTVQAKMKNLDNEWTSSATKIVVLGSGGGSTNPPVQTPALSDITATPASISIDGTSTLSVGITNVSDITGYSVDWSVNNANATLPNTKNTTFDSDKKTKITLTGVVAGEVTVTATLKKAGTTIDTKTTKVTITTISSSDEATLTGIKVGNDTATTPFVTKSYSNLVFKPIGTKLDGKKINWSMSTKQDHDIGNTGFKFGNTTGNTATEVAVTSDVNFKVDMSAVPGEKVFTITATIDGETGEGKTVSREFTIEERPIVQSITLNNATATNGTIAAVAAEHSIALNTPYNLNAATVSPENALPYIIWRIDESSGLFSQQGSADPKDIIYNIDNENKLTLSVNENKETPTIPDTVTVIAEIPYGLGVGILDHRFEANFTIPIIEPTPPADSVTLSAITVDPQKLVAGAQNAGEVYVSIPSDVENMDDYSVYWEIGSKDKTPGWFLPSEVKPITAVTSVTTNFGNAISLQRDKNVTLVPFTTVDPSGDLKQVEKKGTLTVTATLKKDGKTVGTPVVKEIEVDAPQMSEITADLDSIIYPDGTPTALSVNLTGINEKDIGDYSVQWSKGGMVTLVNGEQDSLGNRVTPFAKDDTGNIVSSQAVRQSGPGEAKITATLLYDEHPLAESQFSEKTLTAIPAVTRVEFNYVTVGTSGDTVDVGPACSITLGTPYDLSGATVESGGLARDITWTVDEASKVAGMNYNINNNKLTVTVDMTNKTQVTVPENVVVVGEVAHGVGYNQPFVAKFRIPIAKPETLTADNIVLVKDNAIVGTADTISLSSTDSTPITVKAFLQPAFENKSLTVESSNDAVFTVSNENLNAPGEYTLEAVAEGDATLKISVAGDANTKKEYTVKVQNDAAPSTFSARQAAPNKMTAAPKVQPVSEKPYVIDITLPTQECEVGKNFDLSQAQLQSTGKNNFNISWIVGRGYADMPDDTTVCMDRTGSVVMTAVVVGGKADGDVYTKDFEITFVEPKSEPVTEVPEQKEEVTEVPEQKEEVTEVPEQKEEVTEVPEQKEEVPAMPEQKEEVPVIPEQKEEVPVIPEQKEEVPVVPEQKEEVPAVPEQKEEVPAVPEQKEEVTAVPEQKEEVPVIPEQKEEVTAVPEQKEEIPVVTVQPEDTPTVSTQPVTTPTVPAIPEDKSIVISTKGELMTNNEILLYAKNADGTGTNYQNAVWSIVKDDGTNSVIEKNVLVAKNTGTVVIKVTIGHGVPRIRTKVIEIAQ